MTYLEFCMAVAQLNNLVSFRVTSWWRSPASNRSLPGSARWSWHQVGMAVDVVLDERKNLQLLNNMAEKLGLELIDEDSHFHIEPKG